ncbi:unnamed protein product, partial [Symbiodinium microadriaticum]
SIDLKAAADVLSTLKLKETRPDCVTFFVDEANNAAIDVFKYGSVCFYNFSVPDHESYVKKLMAIPVAASESSFTVDGYDIPNMIGSTVSSEDGKADICDLMTKEFPSLQAYGVNLARDAAMEFYNMALDRVIDGIYCLDEEALRSHITHLVTAANSVDPSGAVTFPSEEANRLFAEFEVDTPTLHILFWKKIRVLVSQYNIKGVPEVAYPLG